jgi:hypothetical protein
VDVGLPLDAGITCPLTAFASCVSVFGRRNTSDTARAAAARTRIRIRPFRIVITTAEILDATTGCRFQKSFRNLSQFPKDVAGLSQA